LGRPATCACKPWRSLSGARGITGDPALRLAHLFGTNAQFCFNLQTLYDLRVARQKCGKSITTLPTVKRSESVHAQVLALLPGAGRHTPMIPMHRASQLRIFLNKLDSKFATSLHSISVREQIASAENSARKEAPRDSVDSLFSRLQLLGWSGILFAILQSACTAVIAISGIRVAVGLSALAAAAGIHAPAKGFHQDAVRIPMMLLALLGSLINLFVIWKIRHLRNRPASQWRPAHRRMDHPSHHPPCSVSPSGQLAATCTGYLYTVVRFSSLSSPPFLSPAAHAISC
jgi:hypothetical protein